MKKSPLNERYFGCCAIKCLTSIEPAKILFSIFRNSFVPGGSPGIARTGRYDILVLRFPEDRDKWGLLQPGFSAGAAALIIGHEVNVYISGQGTWQVNLCGGEPEFTKIFVADDESYPH